MAGKDKDEFDDAEANFFGGEDLDWLDDDSEVVHNRKKSPPQLDVAPAPPRAAPASGSMPVAPPPPPPFGGGSGSVVPRDQKEADWANKVTSAPLDSGQLSRAKTLVFSQVPTLPPIDPDEEVTVAHPAPSEIPEEDLPTASVERPAAPAALAPATPEPLPTQAEVFEESLVEAIIEEAPTGDTPLVQTKSPTPIRMEVPEDESRSPVPFSPSTRPRATLPPFAQQSDTDTTWREMSTALMNEAAVAGPNERGEFLFRAGWVYHHKLADMYGAESLYRDALNAGSRNPQLLRELSDVSLELSRWNDTAELLQERAGLLDGVPAAESLREAAIIHLRKLQNPGAGVGRLWDSLEADPNDYASLVLLREHLSDVQPERSDVLERLAALSDGAVAAEALYERGRLLQSTDESAAVAAYKSALDAYPKHGPSFLGLEALLLKRQDHRGLAALYEAEAAAGGAGEGWWKMLAGRHHLAAGDTAEGEAAFGAAATAGWEFAFRERQARLFQSGAWAELASSIEEEIANPHATPGRAFLWFRLGWLRERHLTDLEGALDAYQKAAAIDPAAGPAVDAARRVLRRRKDTAALTVYLEERLAEADPGARKSILYRLAETAEDAGDHASAAKWYRQVVDADPKSASGLAGLSRTLTHLGAWKILQQVYQRRADLASGPELEAYFLVRAATVGQSGVIDAALSVKLHRRALDRVPDHLAALEQIIPLLEAEQSWAELGATLRSAAEATGDRDLKLLLFYRAGRVFAMRTADKKAARACLAACLELDADYEPALQLVLDLSTVDGDTQRVCTWYRAQAARASSPAVRDWSWFAAAVMAGLGTEPARGDIRMLLQANPDHPGARGAWELVCLANDDYDALSDICRSELVGAPTLASARNAVRLAEILIQRGRTEDAAAVLSDLATMKVASAPLQPAARLARRAQALPVAGALLAAIDEPWAKLERASLMSRKRRDRDESRALIREVIAEEPDNLAAALVASRIGAVSEDFELMALGQALLGRHGESKAMRTANALWAASLYEDLDRCSEALGQYQLARSVCPSSHAAAVGAFRCLVLSTDAAEIRALATTTTILDPIAVAAALSHSGDIPGAIGHLRSSNLTPELPGLLHLEQLLMNAEDWQGAYEALVRRTEICCDETQRHLLESKRRWLLAEKLAHTEQAFEYYQKLHESQPADREITEALARIAGARGDTETAISLLTDLANGASVPEDSARYKRRVAEAHAAVGDRPAARQAYLDALDYLPSDSESLAGLKRIATEDEDWPGLIQVLQREADLVDGDPEIEVRREIARVNEEKLSLGRVAIDAWRAVLEISPQDTEALEHLLALAEAESEWGVFIETGNVLAALAKGAERTTLLRRIGVVCIDQLKRDDAIRYFEQAISEEPPDLEAAQRLEKLYEKRPDWVGVERALDVQGRVAETEEARVSALTRAARLQLDTHHDRESASRYYRRILKIVPSHEPALRFMASHLFESGRFDEALPVCERLAPVVENDQDLEDFDTRMELAQFYFYFAEMLRLAGDRMGSMGRYARALELNPTHLACLEAVGPLYCENEQWKKAEMVYRQLIQLSGGQGESDKVASTYTQLGLVERALGVPEKAQKRFNKALAICPNHVDALKGMALLLEDREDWSNLLNSYNSIIYHATVAQDVIDAYMTKGRILDDHMSRPDKAAQHYQRSLDFKSDQPVAILRLAELEMRKDNYREATELAEKALRIEGRQTEQIRPLLLLCQAVGRQDAGKQAEAQALLAEVRKTDLGKTIPAGALSDLEALRQFIKDALPI